MTFAVGQRWPVFQAYSGLAKSLLVSLQGYWLLDFAQSGGTVDSSNNGNTLTANNTPTATTGPSGRLPYATHFTRASNQYFSLADNPSISTGRTTLSICAWVYADSFDSGQSNRILNKMVSPNYEYNLDVNTGSSYRFEVSTDGTTTSAVAGGTPATGVWVFVVVTADGAALNLYLNAASPSTQAFTGTIRDGTAALNIGTLTGGNGWDGRIAGVGKWDRALTVAEVSYLYNNGEGRNFRPGVGFV